MESTDPLPALQARYFRQVIGTPDGMITHHGDCHMWAHRVCTCGLLHDLVAIDWTLASTVYPQFSKDIAIQDRALRC